MSSGYSPIWRRILFKIAPFIFSVCKEGNWHWRWDKKCFCVDGEVHERINGKWTRIF